MLRQHLLREIHDKLKKMRKAHSHTWFSNVHSETQKLRRQNANALRLRSARCLFPHVIVQFPNSRHMYALRTYFWKRRKKRVVLTFRVREMLLTQWIQRARRAKTVSSVNTIKRSLKQWSQRSLRRRYTTLTGRWSHNVPCSSLPRNIWSL